MVKTLQARYATCVFKTFRSNLPVEEGAIVDITIQWPEPKRVEFSNWAGIWPAELGDIIERQIAEDRAQTAAKLEAMCAELEQAANQERMNLYIADTHAMLL